MKEFYKMTRYEKEEVIRKITDFLRIQQNMAFVYIFGSFTEAEATSFRDIDIGIFLNPIDIDKNQVFDYECNLAVELSKRISFPPDLLDIKILNFAPNNFLNNIFSRGKLLFSKDDELLVDMIENVSIERLSNEYIINQSLKELIPA